MSLWETFHVETTVMGNLDWSNLQIQSRTGGGYLESGGRGTGDGFNRHRVSDFNSGHRLYDKHVCNTVHLNMARMRNLCQVFFP